MTGAWWLLALLMLTTFTLGWVAGGARCLRHLLRLIETNADLRVLLAEYRVRQEERERSEAS